MALRQLRFKGPQRLNLVSVEPFIKCGEASKLQKVTGGCRHPPDPIVRGEPVTVQHTTK